MPTPTDKSHHGPMIHDAPEPRWPALLALVAVGGLYLALPKSLTVGPRWLLLVIVTALGIPNVIAFHHKHYKVNQILGYLMSIVVTLAMVMSLTLLVRVLPYQKEPPIILLRSATALWLTNIIVFALWYWRLDGGGPHSRDRTPGHTDGAFLFPQMTMSPQARKEAGEENWSPKFADYLFIAFNASSAFSPTDTAVLSRWAKVLMMIQSMISIAVVALLAARAINTL